MISTKSEPSRPLLLGHRGARKYAPENTLEAFELALEHGCDGFEFDVRSTADRRLLIWHDATVKRMPVASAQYANLCERSQRGWRGVAKKQAKAIPIPCLEEVIAAYADRAYLNIEVKVPGIEEAVAKSVAAHQPQRGYLVSSFQPEVVLKLRSLNADLRVGWIVSDLRLLASWKTLEMDVLVTHYSLVSRGLVEAVHTAGRKLFTWTVNRPRLMLEMAEWGVDAIISDDTLLLAETLG